MELVLAQVSPEFIQLRLGLDVITACDIRLCTQDALFCVKEVDLGITADVGVLQRLPRIVGNQGWVRHICFTGKNVEATEALHQGLVSQVFIDKVSLIGLYSVYCWIDWL